MDKSFSAEAEIKLTEWMELYQVPLERMCCIWLKDRYLAQDALQETFLRAFRALPRFRGECSEKNWLMRIAVNVCRNMQRNGWMRRVDRSIDVQSLPLAAPSRNDSLYLAICHLSPRQKEAILLYYYQDMNLDEIAAIVNASPSTVSRRIKAAKEELQRQLKGECP